MSNPPSRELRDALAAAIWNADDPGERFLWHLIDAPTQERMRLRADDVLAVASSITDPSTGLKLTIGWGG